MKTILLLGGFGFLGTNILKFIDNHEELSKRFRFIVFDRIIEHPHGIKFSSIEKVYSGDFSDEFFLDRIFVENKIDFVIHSLSSTVPSTSQNARYDVETNLVSTLKLLSVMDRHDVKEIVYISSGGAIYGDVLKKVHNEEDAVYPKSSYGVVKLAIEKYLLSYAELYEFKPLILRVSNPFGKYHYNDKQGVVNIAIRKSLNRELFEIWGSGDGVKDYIYVEDFCSIMFRLIDKGFETNVFNVGGGLSLSVNDIYESIKNLNPSFECKHVNESLLDVQSFELDITKLRRELGKLTYKSFPDALKETYEWQEEL